LGFCLVQTRIGAVADMQDTSSKINELHELWFRAYNQGVRSAKPLCVGSIPTRASNLFLHLAVLRKSCRFVLRTWRFSRQTALELLLEAIPSLSNKLWSTLFFKYNNRFTQRPQLGYSARNAPLPMRNFVSGLRFFL